MAAKHIFILWSNPLFQDSVSRLLDHPDIVCMGSAEISTASLPELQQQHLDAIIFEKKDSTTTGEIINLLEPGSKTLRLIGFNLEDNEIWSCHYEHKTISKAEDLVEMVLR